MQPFAYFRPDTLGQAVSVLAEHGPAARLLGGGTDLVVRLRLGHVRPAIVVDTKGIAELRDEIVETATGLQIGGRVTMSTLILGIAAAIGAAVNQAVGVSMRELPLTPERVWRAIRDRTDHSLPISVDDPSVEW